MSLLVSEIWSVFDNKSAKKKGVCVGGKGKERERVEGKGEERKEGGKGKERERERVEGKGEERVGGGGGKEINGSVSMFLLPHAKQWNTQ